MKTVTLTLTQDKTFRLNELALSKEDLGLFLELLGFSVSYEGTIPQFFLKSLNTLATVEVREFNQLFNDFKHLDRKTKKEYQRIAAMFKIANRNLN